MSNEGDCRTAPATPGLLISNREIKYYCILGHIEAVINSLISPISGFCNDEYSGCLTNFLFHPVFLALYMFTLIISIQAREA